MLGAEVREDGLLVVRSQAQLWGLQDTLLGERDYPVIVLTQSEETLQPALSPERVRAITGVDAVVYYIPGEFLLREMRSLLGAALAVGRGNARIFWPGLSPVSDSGDHPLVVILDVEPEAQALAEFARQFDLSRPSVRGEIRQIEDARSVLQGRLDAATADVHQTAERLRDVNIERHEAITRAERVEGSLARESPSAVTNAEDALHVLIAREWRRAFTAGDRRKHPLGPYVLAPGFIAAVEANEDLVRERIAWVCAMVACGYASALPRVSPQPVSVGKGWRGANRAQRWACNINSEGGPRMYYWIDPRAVVEFADIEAPGG